MDWSQFARAYDQQLPLEAAALAAAVELADPRPDDTLLDLGTGTGGLLRLLAERPDRPRTAIGVDDCPAMLDQARALPDGCRCSAATPVGCARPTALSRS